MRSARRVHGGWSIAVRGVFTLADGRTVFAKMGTVPDTIAAIRTECGVLPVVQGAFVPRVIALDPGVPLVVIEDLSGAEWPPPWNAERLGRVFALLDELGATPGAASLPPLVERLAGWGSWTHPERLRSSGEVPAEWLDRHLARLSVGADLAWAEGDRLLHVDVRSDNLCFAGERTLLVDWNHAARGNPVFDRVLWLPTVQLEGGPPPWELAPDADPRAVSYLLGFFADRIGLPPPEGAPTVREFQLAQFRVVLPWACRALGIDPPSPVLDPKP